MGQDESASQSVRGVTPEHESLHERLERTIPIAIRERVLDRDNEQCQVCGTNHGLHLHHWRTFRSQGGGHEAENLVTVCARCHWLIHQQHIDVVLLEVMDGIWRVFVYRGGPREGNG